MMLQTFIQDIKPLNDQLGVSLKMNTIEVQQESTEQEILVNVTFKSRHGQVVKFTNRQIKNYRALGLTI
jgi:hypothetical protein